MKNEITYLFEYLSKSENKAQCELYRSISSVLSSLGIYTLSSYTQKQIILLLNHNDIVPPRSIDEAVITLDKRLETFLPEALTHSKNKIFMTLVTSNFPTKKSFLEHSYELFISQLEPVEKNIYNNLSLYVLGLNRGLGIFFTFCSNNHMVTPEQFVSFGDALHAELIRLIYNEKEQELLGSGLKELLGVYLSIYGKYLFS